MLYDDVFKHPEHYDFSIEELGKASITSPILGRQFVQDSESISFFQEGDKIASYTNAGKAIPVFQKAGPREKIYHDPSWTRAAVVTCGGLCPGLNDVIKGIVNVLSEDYGVKHIYGIRFGYRGLSPKFQHPPLELTSEIVDTIHEDGGTILGSSRGEQDVGEMVDTLIRMNINILFTIGGDGTLRGAQAIAEEIKSRGVNISVIGLPKTIDNDLNFIERTFGFESAVYAAADIITAAHMEARGAFNGIGLVKLMGRDSGFIAGFASMANSVVNICLIPEVAFSLKGPHGLLKALERRFDSGKDHAVIVVAEGAGQELFKEVPEQRDASGNILKHDIGLLLKQQINEHFKSKNKEVNIKYFDPSYYIRSVPAKGTDAIFCYLLAENAVHAAMAGKTNMVVGFWNNHYTYVPIPLATLERKKINPLDALWNAVLSITQQQKYF